MIWKWHKTTCRKLDVSRRCHFSGISLSFILRCCVYIWDVFRWPRWCSAWQLRQSVGYQGLEWLNREGGGPWEGTWLGVPSRTPLLSFTPWIFGRGAVCADQSLVHCRVLVSLSDAKVAVTGTKFHLFCKPNYTVTTSSRMFELVGVKAY